VKSCCETCWKEKLINMRAKKAVEKVGDTCEVSCDIPIPWQNLLPECAWCTYSVAELAGKVCAMYWFRRRTSCRNVCNVLIHYIDGVHYAPGSH
jgi:hypothetical protein